VTASLSSVSEAPVELVSKPLDSGCLVRLNELPAFQQAADAMNVFSPSKERHRPLLSMDKKSNHRPSVGLSRTLHSPVLILRVSVGRGLKAKSAYVVLDMMEWKILGEHALNSYMAPTPRFHKSANSLPAAFPVKNFCTRLFVTPRASQ
jgi:hypothetical protein